MICYIDSSALVKRYIDETGSDQVRILVAADNRIVVSWLAMPEVLSAVVRRGKGTQSEEEMKRFREQLHSDFERFLVVDVSDSAVLETERLILRHGLRGADSIHLSTALWAARTLAAPVLFVASDRELLEAARGERMTVLDPAAPTR